MIEFKGEQSNDCKIMIAALRGKKSGLVISLINLLLAILVLLLGLYNNLWMAIVLVILLILLSFFSFVTPKERVKNFKIDYKICIGNNLITQTYNTMFQNKTTTKKLSNIKKVLDYGKFYAFVFKFGDITNAWICEKDHIKNGTIEDFEKLFADKIIRKY
ncbi:MAG: hypothetical protein IKK20_01160 [Clostridia bacterium]|nr:hypothetical protein [Clostridia bacterium]MBR2433524.1 hypothetical protein [Clostridia bacterium]MBR3790396.1 hypothetical protein [Clostridia bacterium]